MIQAFGSAAQEKVGRGRFWSVFVRTAEHFTQFCLLAFFFSLQIFSFHQSPPPLLKPSMKPQLFAVDLMLLCMSCGASALATSVAAVSTSNFTHVGEAHGRGSDAATSSKIRRKRYISQNDMLAILDYHNKVRGKVFPPASNMEYMVSEVSFICYQCMVFLETHTL